MNSILSILYVIGLYGAYLAGFLSLRRPAEETPGQQHQVLRKIPYTTLIVGILIAIPSTLQFFFPVILQTFERDYAGFLSGDWWRLVTSLFVQDGGILGAFFNLVSLLLVGAVAEQFWDSRRWLLIFFAGGILSQFVGFLWQPVGAGNSVANFALAAGLAVYCLVFYSSRPVRIATLMALGAGGILLFLKDIHGSAMFIGASLALILVRWNGQKATKQR